MSPFHLLAGRLLMGSVILSLIGTYTLILKSDSSAETEMRLSPNHDTLTLEEEVTLSVVVQSTTAVNAFSGFVTFDPDILQVSSIDYNTSIANLWVEEPWYSLGSGKISFAGGTTIPGGFSGEGNLLQITFRPLKYGNASIKLHDAHIFKHDGFGTEASLPTPIDTLFSVETLESMATGLKENRDSGTLAVIADMSDFDLNNDNDITFADVSIFMLHVFGKNTEYDFNRDDLVDFQDLNLLLEARKAEESSL